MALAGVCRIVQVKQQEEEEEEQEEEEHQQQQQGEGEGEAREANVHSGLADRHFPYAAARRTNCCVNIYRFTFDLREIGRNN